MVEGAPTPALDAADAFGVLLCGPATAVAGVKQGAAALLLLAAWCNSGVSAAVAACGSFLFTPLCVRGAPNSAAMLNMPCGYTMQRNPVFEPQSVVVGAYPATHRVLMTYEPCVCHRKCDTPCFADSLRDQKLLLHCRFGNEVRTADAAPRRARYTVMV